MTLLLKAPGGKYKAAGDILRLLPTSYREYREPFAYSAGVYWHIPPDKLRWLNDKNPSVAHFYHWFRDDPTAIDQIEHLRSTLLTATDIENYFYRCKYYYVVDDDPLSYLYLTRYAWYQIVDKNRGEIASFDRRCLGKGGINVFNRRRLQMSREILQSTHLTQGDYAFALLSPPRGAWKPEDVVIYCDPPYRDCNKKHSLYPHKMTDDEYRALAVRMRHSRYRIILSIGAEDFSRDLFCRPWFDWRIRGYVGSLMSTSRGRYLQDMIVRNWKE